MRCLFLMLFTFSAFGLQSIPLTLTYSQKSEQLDLSSPVGIPAISQADAGKVSARKADTHLFPYPLFVIGGDRLSREWLLEHQQQLRDLQAIGFITNVDDFNLVASLQEQSQLPLLPVNVDPLMKLFGIKHYPVVIAKGELWQ